MAAQGGVTTTTAQAGSALACCGVNQQQTRLYLIRQLDGNIGELADTADGWQSADYAGARPAASSALACCGVGGVHPHAFYLDQAAQLVELQPDAPSDDPLPIEVADGSPLAGLALGEKDYRLFYVNADRVLYELVADDGSARYQEILNGSSAAPGTRLACTHDSRGLVTVFYVDAADNLLHALHHTSVQVPGEFGNEPIKGTDPAPGTALTCFTMTGTNDARAYYLDGQGQIIEVQWKKSTNALTVHPLHYQAKPGSALTCFGVGGLHPRLYYLDDQAEVTELAWQDGAWHQHSLHVTAAPDSDLTCYGADGKWTRLYYLDPQYRVNELAYDGTAKKFVNTAR